MNRPCAQPCLSCAWLCASISTTLMNKHLAAAAPGALVLTFVQLFVSCTVFGAMLLCEERAKFLERERVWLGLWIGTMPLLFVFGIAANLLALQLVELSTWLVARNVEPVFVAITESFVPSLRDPPTALRLCSLCGLFVGVVLANHSVFTNHSVFHIVPSKGTIWCVVSVCTGAVSRVWQAWLLKQLTTPRTTLVFYNHVGGSLLMGVYLSQFDATRAATLLQPSSPFLGMLTSCIPATFLAFTGIHLQEFLSASQMAALGCLSKIVLMLFSVAVERRDDVTRLVGIGMSFVACVVYSMGRVHARPEHEEEPLIRKSPQ